MEIVEPVLTDFIASEIVTGYTGAQMACPARARRAKRGRGGIRKKNPGGQVERVQRSSSVESERQQPEIGIGQFRAPLEQAHRNEEMPIRKKGTLPQGGTTRR